MPKFNIETPKSSNHKFYNSFNNNPFAVNPSSSSTTNISGYQLNVNPNMMSFNKTSKNPFSKPPVQIQNNNAIRDLNENVRLKDKEIKNLKSKINKLVNDMQIIDDETNKYSNLIEKEECEGERLRHFLNYLMTVNV